MTNEQINKIASQPTLNNTRTVITLKNKTKIVGYFEGNQKNNELYHQNKWNFVISQQPNNECKQTTYNGDDFELVEIIELYPI